MGSSGPESVFQPAEYPVTFYTQLLRRNKILVWIFTYWAELSTSGRHHHQQRLLKTYLLKMLCLNVVMDSSLLAVRHKHGGVPSVISRRVFVATVRFSFELRGIYTLLSVQSNPVDGPASQKWACDAKLYGKRGNVSPWMAGGQPITTPHIANRWKKRRPAPVQG